MDNLKEVLEEIILQSEQSDELTSKEVIDQLIDQLEV